MQGPALLVRLFIMDREERGAEDIHPLAGLLRGVETEMADVLLLTRRLIANGWDNEWASDEYGNQVQEWQDEAVNFNLLAAYLKAEDILDFVIDLGPQEWARRRVDEVVFERYGTPVTYEWQTDPRRTKQEILDILDATIQRLRKGQHGRQP